jgi:hypothetical protein
MKTKIILEQSLIEKSVSDESRLVIFKTLLRISPNCTLKDIFEKLKVSLFNCQDVVFGKDSSNIWIADAERKRRFILITE